MLAALEHEGGLPGARVLIPCAQDAREVLPEGLRAAGADVTVIPVYTTLRTTDDGERLANAILSGLVDAVTFTSPSTVDGFVALVGEHTVRSGQFAAVVIGPVTAQAARDAGMGDLVMAARSSVEGLADALSRRFAASA